MPHHREGIQEQLDKAYDEGHRDNKAIDALEVEVIKEERGHMDDKEMRGELSLEETVALLKDKGYLDTSFEGKETHRLEIRPLSKEEAIREYEKSGGEILGWWGIESSGPYTVPQAENLDVMMVSFNRDISNEDALEEMLALGVRSLKREELLQYGIQNPVNKKTLVAINKEYGSFSVLEAFWARGRGDYSGFDVGYSTHKKPIRSSVDYWEAEYIFPVVRK